MNQVKKELGNHLRENSLHLVTVVDELGEETRVLALNLALYLAKAKSRGGSEQLQKMEPDFVRLINGTVRVIQDVTVIISAARNQEKMVYTLPSGEQGRDRIMTKLESISDQCREILASLGQCSDITA